LILENARESFVILDNELAVLESYLSLQAMYHEGKFDYDIDVDSSIQKDHVQIPPMLLQPFVENAIQHGFQHTSHQGKLSIQIVKLPNALYCRIEDNGGGIQASKETITKRIHAIDITLERLKILGKQTKMPAKLTVVDKKSRNEGDGVRVEMEIPYLPA
jgi:LytS/YehU family sensor histidine kinase